MLDLSEIAAGFYEYRDRTCSAPLIEKPGDFKTWTPGTKLVGFSSRSRPLTDGTPADTYFGCPWVAEWQIRSTHLLVSLGELQYYVFQVGQLDLTFVGHGDWSGNAPSKVAFPKSALAAGFEEERTSKHPQTCPEKAFFTALKAYGLKATFRREGYGDSRRVAFTVLAPVSRGAWLDLGYHIYTNATSTKKEVVALTAGLAACFEAPFSTVEEALENGVELERLMWAGAQAKITLGCDGFVILDPQKAAPHIPFAAHCLPGTRFKYKIWAFDNIAFPLDRLDQLEPLSGTLEFIKRGGAELIGVPASALRPRSIVTGSRGEGTVIVATPEAAEKHLVRVAKVATVRAIPPNVHSYPVYINGEIQKGRSYLRREIEGLPTRKNKKAELAARRAELERVYGVLPDDWASYTEEDLASLLKWDKAKADGWVDVGMLAQRLGLVDYENPFWIWLKDAEWPHATCRRETRPLVQPMTLEDLVSMEDFPQFFSRTVGKVTPFVLKCMFNETARASLMVSAFAA